jgi:phospholipid-transporting ATPase
MPQFYVGFYSLFSGQSIYDPWLYQLFNILFSVLPILWFGIYDSERTTTVAMSKPKFYTSMNKKLYSNRNFWRWIFLGILQGLAVFVFVFSSNNIYANNDSGEIQDFKSSGMMTYSVVVIIVNLKVFQLTSVHGAVSLFFLVFSIGAFYILTYLMSIEPNMFYFGAFWRMIKNVRYFFILGLLCIGVTAISAGLVYLSKICYKYEENTKHDKIMYKYYKNLENDKKMKKKKKKKEKNKNKNKIKDKKVNKELIEEDSPYQ